MSSTATRILSHIIQAFIFNVLTMVVDMYFSSPQNFLKLFHCTFDLQHPSPFSIIFPPFPTIFHHYASFSIIFPIPNSNFSSIEFPQGQSCPSSKGFGLSREKLREAGWFEDPWGFGILEFGTIDVGEGEVFFTSFLKSNFHLGVSKNRGFSPQIIH